jgi:hypothetical protein
MAYLTLVLLGVLLVSVCGDSVPLPDRSPSPTTQVIQPTPRAASSPSPVRTIARSSPCEHVEFPEATLTGEAVQSGCLEAVNWNDPATGCGVNGHPFAELILPATPITLPPGGQLQLVLSEQPTELRASVELMDVQSLSPVYRGDYTEIFPFDWSSTESTYIEVARETVQTLDLSQFSQAADIVLSVGASFTEGGTGWNFWLTGNGVRK